MISITFGGFVIFAVPDSQSWSELGRPASRRTDRSPALALFSWPEYEPLIQRWAETHHDRIVNLTFLRPAGSHNKKPAPGFKPGRVE
jgi:hypothetical protein